jgi:tetratricopeptide (TPR) repeat protein
MGAIADYNRTIKLDPVQSLAYYKREVLKSNLQDFKGAIADFDRAIEISPNYESAYINRGSMKGNLKDFKGAIDDFDMAIELNPENGLVYYNRGLIKIYSGQKDSGCLDLSKAGDLGYSNAYELINKFCK